ncbi:hypothetical protein AB0F88_01890 [Streptosporangium sp. NPDC023963]
MTASALIAEFDDVAGRTARLLPRGALYAIKALEGGLRPGDHVA